MAEVQTKELENGAFIAHDAKHDVDESWALELLAEIEQEEFDEMIIVEEFLEPIDEGDGLTAIQRQKKLRSENEQSDTSIGQSCSSSIFQKVKGFLRG